MFIREALGQLLLPYYVGPAQPRTVGISHESAYLNHTEATGYRNALSKSGSVKPDPSVGLFWSQTLQATFPLPIL